MAWTLYSWEKPWARQRLMSHPLAGVLAVWFTIFAIQQNVVVAQQTGYSTGVASAWLLPPTPTHQPGSFPNPETESSVAARLPQAGMTSVYPEHSIVASQPSPMGAPAATLVSGTPTAGPANFASQQFEPMPVRVQTWLPSVTPSIHYRQARQLLDQAHREYAVSALASAESSVWGSLHKLALSIDVSSQYGHSSGAHVTASEDLAIAETALREAKDFAGRYGNVDTETLARFVESHQTKVLKRASLEAVTANEAIDRYLNESRVRLARLTTASSDVAEAIDLLASIHLKRNQPNSLAQEVSLCLRRAALQGQPGNAMLASALGQQLARAGLIEESRWALEHSLRLERHPATMTSLAEVFNQLGDPGTADQIRLAAAREFPNAMSQRARTPEVIQLSPEQFASVSRPVMLEPVDATGSTINSRAPIDRTPAFDRQSTSASLASASTRTSMATTTQSPSAAAGAGASPERRMVIENESDSQKRPSFFHSLFHRARGSE